MYRFYIALTCAVLALGAFALWPGEQAPTPDAAASPAAAPMSDAERKYCVKNAELWAKLTTVRHSYLDLQAAPTTSKDYLDYHHNEVRLELHRLLKHLNDTPRDGIAAAYVKAILSDIETVNVIDAKLWEARHDFTSAEMRSAMNPADDVDHSALTPLCDQRSR